MAKPSDQSTADHQPSTRLIPLGVITTPHGIRGQVKIRSFTAHPEDITSYGMLTDKTGRAYNITVTGQTRDVLIATIEGVASRDEAEKLRNTELCVHRSTLPDAKENEYYYEDLTGVKVLTSTGEPYGTITAVHNFGAGDLVAIKLESGEEELLPFTRATFPKIDIKKGVTTIEPPAIIQNE